jgi:hypothetical protein
MAEPTGGKDEPHFSEAMLRWLDEGDRLSTSAEHTSSSSLPASSRRLPRREIAQKDRTLIIGAAFVGLAAIVVLRVAGGAPAVHTAEAVAPAPAPCTLPVPPRTPRRMVIDPIVVEASSVKPAAAAPTAAPQPVPAAPAVAAAPIPVAPAVAVAAAPPAPPAAAVKPAPAPAIPAPPAPAASPTPSPAAKPAIALALFDEPPIPAAGFGSDELSLCRGEIAAGRIQGALDACRHAVDAQPRSSEALTLLAEAEYSRGRGREAMRLASEAVAADPHFVEAYAVIGAVHQDQGHMGEAHAAYRRYLAIAPRGPRAAELSAIVGH